MQMIDTHTHLYVEAFDEDRTEVIQSAIDSGVSKFYLPAIDSHYTKRMLDLASAYPEHIRLMSGLHPTHVKENAQEELAHVKEMLDKYPFCAVGEIGIDLYWEKRFLKAQQNAFDLQIQWAKAHHLPIVIHCRDAFDEVFEVLETHKGEDLFGIFHCFSGDFKAAQRAIDFNLKLGIGGIVTFKNGKIDQFLNQLPLSSLVLETDAPYLAPTPYRGKRNESAYLPIIAQRLAELFALPLGEIVAQTTKNAEMVFQSNV
ncbi:MAG: TatD family hydrolase [Flavobacteriaceae bacterium]